MVFRSVPDSGPFEPWEQRAEEDHESQRRRLELEREREQRAEVDEEVRARLDALPWWRKLGGRKRRMLDRELRAEVWKEREDPASE